MYRTSHDIQKFLANNKEVARIDVVDTRGSTPRETGTWMLVGKDSIFRTIGGGELENMAIDKVRTLLGQPDTAPIDMKIPLGPEIGQCCGGSVDLRVNLLDEVSKKACVQIVEDEMCKLPHVYVFGAGHVGNALCKALTLLPVNPILVDTREKELAETPEGVVARHTAMPEIEVRNAPTGSAFVILTHDHALDFLIAQEALTREDASYIGMIGSKTKRATFKNWFAREGGDAKDLEHLVCPIGNTAIHDKRPEIIAALATAEILEHLHKYANHLACMKKQENINL